VQNVGANFTIFPSGPNRRIHASIEALLRDSPNTFSLGRTIRFLSIWIWLADRIFGGHARALFMKRELSKKHFDVLHFHEMQSGGYPLTHLSSSDLEGTKVVYTPYGSDMFWYQNFRRHALIISKTLRRVDSIFPECERDAVLARKHGFSGEILQQMPAAGLLAFDAQALPQLPGRKKITIKGYGGKWGRAIQVLQSLELIDQKLLGFEIHVTSVTSDVSKEIQRLQKSSSLRLVPHPKFSLSSQQVKDILLDSKYHIALSESDGFPASLMEAVTCGVIPIQSNTACLPDDLLEISPGNFLAKENWPGVGELVLALELQGGELQNLSNKFSDWAQMQRLELADFIKIIRAAYGIAPQD
jgi:hypothetical protein